MSTRIYHYTGTGNSLWTAQLVADEVGSCELLPMIEHAPARPLEADLEAIGLVFPVHMWGVPRLVLRFLRVMPRDPSKYYFAVAVNAGQVSRTLLQLRSALAEVGLALPFGMSVKLPSNYLPWGGAPPACVQEELFAEARRIVKSRIQTVVRRQSEPLDHGPLLHRIVFTLIYKLTFSRIPSMDRSFWLDENCNGCGICQRICPVDNVIIVNGKPVWRHRCEQCLACIQWCPKAAIQFGKKTPGFSRYHHPDVHLKELLARSTFSS